MIWKPNVTVAAVIEQNGRFLVVEERDTNQIVFNQPAGHLEKDESLLEAVCRETLEETGRNFTPHAVTGVYRLPHASEDVTYLRFCFCGTCSEPLADKELDVDIIATHWKSREQLTQLALRSPLVLRSIDDYLLGKRFDLDLLIEP